MDIVDTQHSDQNIDHSKAFRNMGEKKDSSSRGEINSSQISRLKTKLKTRVLGLKRMLIS